MLGDEVLVRELVTVDRQAARPVLGGEVAPLDHEALDDAVEWAAFIPHGRLVRGRPILPCAKLPEVLGGFGHNVSEELERDAANVGVGDLDVEKDDGIARRGGPAFARWVGVSAAVGGFRVVGSGWWVWGPSRGGPFSSGVGFGTTRTVRAIASLYPPFRVCQRSILKPVIGTSSGQASLSVCGFELELHGLAKLSVPLTRTVRWHVHMAKREAPL